jgi:glycosyltransferase involved in cell wall biosynthesis
MKMNIGQFVIRFPCKNSDEVYGSERITFTLCKELSKMDVKVHVFFPSNKTCIKIMDNLIIHHYNSLLSIQGYYFSYELLKDMLRYELDIVHVHNDSPMAMLAGLKYSKKKNTPLIVTWHGDWLGATRIRKVFVPILNKTLVKICLSQARAIIVPSVEYVNESTVLRTYEGKIVEIPHGVNLEEMKVPYSKEKCKDMLNLDDKIVILYVGSINEGKGVGVLLRAARKVLANNENVLFVFVGGWKVDEFRLLARKLGIESHVKFTGYVDEEVKMLYYKSADIFVFPSSSRHEVFPVVTLEAASFGLPLIVSDLRIFKNRIKNGYNGIFFRVGDEEDLARAIIRLLEDEELRERIGRNAKREVEERYNSKIMAGLTYKLYKSLTAK